MQWRTSHAASFRHAALRATRLASTSTNPARGTFDSVELPTMARLGRRHHDFDNVAVEGDGGVPYADERLDWMVLMGEALHQARSKRWVYLPTLQPSKAMGERVAPFRSCLLRQL